MTHSLKDKPVLKRQKSHDGGAFHIDVPVVAFEKADEPEGQRRRIAGIISTDGLDQQNEKLLQDGLNFDRFLSTGFFNDEHSSSVSDVVGYPKSVQRYAKGDQLPNGQKAAHNVTWAEGFLCGRKGQDIWSLAQDLEGTGRTLGFSVEGQINARKAEDNRVITSATVTGCALCQRPVNADCRLETLVRSLDAARKAFTVGTIPQQSAEHPIPQPKPNEAKSGEGVGQLLTNMFGKKKRKEKLRKQTTKAAPAQKAAPASPVAKARVLLNESDALNWIRKSVPGVKDATARTFLKTALRMIAQGKV